MVVCIICVSVIDASVAGELPEEGYHQGEEEDYPGHFCQPKSSHLLNHTQYLLFKLHTYLSSN
jgi:hypothetical protein